MFIDHYGLVRQQAFLTGVVKSNRAFRIDEWAIEFNKTPKESSDELIWYVKNRSGWIGFNHRIIQVDDGYRVWCAQAEWFPINSNIALNNATIRSLHYSI